jgi:hypothetical protein
VVKFAIAGIAAKNTSSDQLSTAGYWTILANEFNTLGHHTRDEAVDGASKSVFRPVT